MKDYNFVIIENKQRISYLNLSQQAFYDELWKWTYEDDLWDYIDEVNPSEEELEKGLYDFIREDVFHEYEDDDVNCFAFVNTDDGIQEYTIETELLEFIKDKINRHKNYLL